MSSLIEELQRDALDPKVPVTVLLQKCLVVGSKLKIQALADWARLELEGYKSADVPDYRLVLGRPQVFNPMRGFQPINFTNGEQLRAFSTMHFNQPASELEHSLRQASGSGSDEFHVSYAPDLEIALRLAIRPLQLSPSLSINASQFHKILEGIRKTVLEWSLRLEAAGVRGEGLSFSAEEKQMAQSVTYNVATHIHGNVDRSQVGAASSMQYVTDNIDLFRLKDIIVALKGAAGQLDIDPKAATELDAEIQTLEAQTSSPKPKISIIRECLATVRNILEGIVGNLAAAAILNQIGNFKI